jgi:hypothetical protein
MDSGLGEEPMALRFPLWLSLLAPLALAACGGGRQADRPGAGIGGAPAGPLLPAARIAAEPIDECSGIVWLDGAYFMHNDSGDEPRIYRSPALDFTAPEILRLPGAEAIDWEDLTLYEGDLLIGDIGDNRHERDHLVLYRARYHPPVIGERPPDGTAEEIAPAAGRLELIAAYPFRYPDGRHNAEALATIDGVVHLITKAEEGQPTRLFAFDELREDAELPPGELNIPRLVASLDLGPGEQATAADYDSDGRTLVVLTYTHLLRFPRERLAGPPAGRTLIGARQCEAICFNGGDLILTNEQRDVFVIDDFLSRTDEALLPPRGAAVLHTCATCGGAGSPPAARPCAIPLKNAREGEALHWCLAGDRLRIWGRVHCEGEFKPSRPPVPGASGEDAETRLGSALLLSFGAVPRWETTAAEPQFAIGGDERGGARIWRLDLSGPRLELVPCAEATIAGGAAGGVFEFEAALSSAVVFGERPPPEFLFDLQGLRLHSGDEVRFSGVDVWTILRPYLWGDVQVAAEPPRETS